MGTSGIIHAAVHAEELDSSLSHLFHPPKSANQSVSSLGTFFQKNTLNPSCSPPPARAPRSKHLPSTPALAPRSSHPAFTSRPCFEPSRGFHLTGKGPRCRPALALLPPRGREPRQSPCTPGRTWSRGEACRSPAGIRDVLHPDLQAPGCSSSRFSSNVTHLQADPKSPLPPASPPASPQITPCLIALLYFPHDAWHIVGVPLIVVVEMSK